MCASSIFAYGNLAATNVYGNVVCQSLPWLQSLGFMLFVGPLWVQGRYVGVGFRFVWRWFCDLVFGGADECV
jgi:hypothetical protein